ncbi:MAG TPA: nuclear transport factor 2 family protein [Longimicrobiales bacterium]|nr:nuclear transport factor 2 family protein [Longimicrobiales bacterium]
MTRATLMFLLLATSCTQGDAQRTAGAAADAQAAASDEAAIRALVAEHYVTAVFRSRDEASVRRGFHPAFTLYVLDDGELIVAPLDMWLERLALDGVPATSQVRHDIVFIDVTGDAAILRAELHVDDVHEYTDYFSLYRFPGERWQIVSKIFQSHD